MKRIPLLLLFTLAIGFQGCYPDPDFDLVPSITFRDVEQNTLRNPQNALYDSFVLVVRFQDGDGNLGLSATEPADSDAPFTFGTKFYHNYFVNLLKKDASGEFKPVIVGGQRITYNGRFPRVSPDLRQEPLEGDIRFKLEIFQNNAIRPGDVVKFEIQIADRALNLSNTITTPEIVMFSK